jgi:RNA polymerase sigma-70 factor (ECF subfamily)
MLTPWRVKAAASSDAVKKSSSSLEGLGLAGVLHNRLSWRETMLQQTVGRRASQQIQPSPSIELDRIPNLRSFADPDAALVEALKARTPAAFDDLVKRYERRLLTVAVTITKNREDAEDVVQESFLKVFKNIDRFRADSKFATWLTRIAINQALMLIRGNTQNFVSIDEGMLVVNRAKRPEITAGGYTPEQLCAQREFEDVMLNLENVRKSSRRVMELRLKHDLSEIEIALVLSLTLSAVKARLYRGRQDLREALNRSLDSAKVARARKNMPPIGKGKQGRSFIRASALAGGNLLPAGSSQSSSRLQPWLPYHFTPQLLTRPRTLQIGGPEIAL